MSCEEITLKIDGSSIKVKKEILTANSDYFKAMLEGNFSEKDKKIIELKDVDLKAMNIILTLLWDSTIYIDDEDVIIILQTACMLQFNSIRDICVEKAVNILSSENCLKIWIITEQLDLKPLYLKAKTVALINFLNIINTESIIELSLEQLCNYIGSVNLQTDNELTVVQVVMKWWYEHKNECQQGPGDLLKLLSCVNFNNLSSNDFKEVLMYPNLKDTEVGEILTCLYKSSNKLSTSNYSPKTRHLANLLSQSKQRTLTSFPCFAAISDEEFPLSLTCSLQTLDRYRRKRPLSSIYKNGNISIWYYDYRTNKFKQVFVLKQQLIGYKILGYKQHVFVFGGVCEFEKTWNHIFSAYNTIKESWQKITIMPFARRDFQSCIAGSKLFIVGGMGPNERIEQEIVACYDFKQGLWSREIPLPIAYDDVKSCEFMNNLFLFYRNHSCGYILNDSLNWILVPMKVDTDLISPTFSVFSYTNKFYIRGRNLIEMVWTDNQLLISSVKKIDDRDYSELESVQCGTAVFTLRTYNPTNKITDRLSNMPIKKSDMEKIDLENGNIEIMHINLTLNSETADVKIKTVEQFFSFAHYNVLAENEFVNNSFINF